MIIYKQQYFVYNNHIHKMISFSFLFWTDFANGTTDFPYSRRYCERELQSFIEKSKKSTNTRLSLSGCPRLFEERPKRPPRETATSASCYAAVLSSRVSYDGRTRLVAPRICLVSEIVTHRDGGEYPDYIGAFFFLFGQKPLGWSHKNVSSAQETLVLRQTYATTNRCRR